MGKFRKGLSDGVPIALGYIMVSLTFGVMAVSQGLSSVQATLISASNVTSAGQFAGLSIITDSGGLLEMALTQLFINMRYFLMSVALSQMLSPSVRTVDRLWMSFVVTDEVFAVSCTQKEPITCKYFAGLILLPFLGWTIGTFIGTVAAYIMPEIVVQTADIAVYGMFLAIIVPEAKKEKPVLICILIAVLLSSAFYYIPFLQGVSSGFSIIICAVSASVIAALCFPREQKEADAV